MHLRFQSPPTGHPALEHARSSRYPELPSLCARIPKSPQTVSSVTVSPKNSIQLPADDLLDTRVTAQNGSIASRCLRKS